MVDSVHHKRSAWTENALPRRYDILRYHQGMHLGLYFSRRILDAHTLVGRDNQDIAFTIRLGFPDDLGFIPGYCMEVEEYLWSGIVVVWWS